MAMAQTMRDAIRRWLTGDHGDYHGTRRETDRAEPEQLDASDVTAMLKDRPR